MADYFEILDGQVSTLATTYDAVSAAIADQPPLPWPERTAIAVAGMGAATNASLALVNWAAERERMALCVGGEHWTSREIPAPGLEQLWLLSESGRSPEPIAVAQHQRLPVTAIVNFLDSPAAKLADRRYWLGEVPDAKVYVSGYTSSLLALGLVAEAAGLAGLCDSREETLRLVSEALPAARVAAREFLDQIRPGAAFDCVGTGPSLAAAAQSALLAREVAHAPSAYFELNQYMHGPMEALAGNCVLLAYGDVDEVVARAVGLIVIHVTDSEPVPGARTLRLPEAAPVTRAILESLFSQVFFGELAMRWGVEIGHFDYMFESAKLPQA